MAGKGKPRTGCVYPHDDHFDARITLPGGKRGRPVCLRPGLSEARAREIAAAMTERAAADIAAEEMAASVTAWTKLWCDDRRRRGLASVSDDEGRLRKWILPHIGARPMATIAKGDLEALVERLDERVIAGDLSWKTAVNAWALVTKMFKDACAAKTKALRVRADNPAAGVVGPDKGVERGKAYLYPSELLKLVACPRVPLRWRRLFALAVYTYARAGELEVLALEDIDLERRLIHIHRALDRDTGKIVETKTGVKRRIPIEAEFLPLLEAMVAEARTAGRTTLIVMPPENDLAETLRRYLQWAGVDRAELFVTDRTRKQLTFHDLRATGITWMAIRGDDPLRIMTRAGHERFDTTQGYIREAENLEGAISAAETFPALPIALLGSSPSWSVPPAINHLESAGATSSDDDPRKSPVVCAASAGSNPAGDAAGGPALAGESGEDEPPSDDDGDDILSTFRRAAEAAREVAARHGGDEGAVLSLLAIELVGELEDTAARVRGAA